MKVLAILAAVLALAVAETVTVVKEEDLTEELLTDPNYLVYEVDQGLYRVEDLTVPANATLLANENQVSFFIFTSESPTRGVEIRLSQVPNLVRNTGFNVNRNTLMIIHGWTQSQSSSVNTLIRNAAFRSNNINIIVADWSPISRRDYVTAQGSVVAVGNHVGDFILRLTREFNYNINRITVAGHSLGAHIAGNAGSRLNGALETIVGMDPAGPLFTRLNTRNRLDPTDGRYVHVIHTNDGTLGFGINMGHVDYYPNGGRSQPGCGIDLAGTCAHSRSYEFFAESFNNDRFVARRCRSMTNYNLNLCRLNTASNMGGFPIRRASELGEYYLATNSRSPFARG